VSHLRSEETTETVMSLDVSRLSRVVEAQVSEERPKAIMNLHSQHHVPRGQWRLSQWRRWTQGGTRGPRPSRAAKTVRKGQLQPVISADGGDGVTSVGTLKGGDDEDEGGDG
jgi:hypothetical protein